MNDFTKNKGVSINKVFAIFNGIPQGAKIFVLWYYLVKTYL